MLPAVRRAVLAGLLAVACCLLWWRLPSMRKAVLETPRRMAELAAVPNTVPGWPPVLGEPFPDVALTDHLGRPFRMNELRGQPVLVELVAMTCAACQAWSGAAERGTFGGFPAQGDLVSVHELVSTWGGVDLRSGTPTFVQLVVYDTALEPPTPAELAAWREHFGLDELPGARVVTGGTLLANGESFRRIPGFLLLDATGRVVEDAAGHAAPNDLYRELLPAIGPLLADAGAVRSR